MAPLADLKIAYLRAMREQAPAMFNELRRSGALDAHLRQKAGEGSLFEELTPLPRDCQGRRSPICR